MRTEKASSKKRSILYLEMWLLGIAVFSLSSLTSRVHAQDSCNQSVNITQIPQAIGAALGIPELNTALRRQIQILSSSP
jgi:hypothetical protein